MSPFTPVGTRARWKVIYDLLTRAEVGDVITYDEMAGALDLDPDDDRHTIQMAMRRAALEHLRNEFRSVEVVRGEGYRIAETVQKLEIASRHQVRAIRQVRRGREHVVNVDLNGVDDATRSLFEAMAWKFAQQDETIHRLDVRQRRHERQLAAAQADHQQTQDQLTALGERLARLEAAGQKT